MATHRSPPDVRSQERLAGIVERVTYHNQQSGWSVVKISPLGEPHRRVAVTLHQVATTPGATMEFWGNWEHHPRFGEQFKCVRARERKPASAAALQRYLGSGLIRGVGPKTARKIVQHFGAETLDVFEGDIDRLVEVRGIAARKLEAIAASWREHRTIRDVMMFLQEHGISTLFAVRIFKRYGEGAIETVRADPYRLARDIFGIGFFSADAVARSLGFDPKGMPRLRAAVRHVLSASREAGHCYLREDQVREQVLTLLAFDEPAEMESTVDTALRELVETGDVRVRALAPPEAASGSETAYYARTLYQDEDSVARLVAARVGRTHPVDGSRVDRWLARHAQRTALALSDEQRDAIRGAVQCKLSILTGGPGCGKTTTLRTLVHLLRAMGRRVVLAAPTGRAAQRMGEVIGTDAKTIHRLLEWDPSTGGFRHGEEYPLDADFVVVDEVSMLDVSIAAALLAAIPTAAQLLLIGDPNQLPSVGPGRVLADLLETEAVTRFELRQVFRQAEASQIVQHAHAINRGVVPDPPSPVRDPGVWTRDVDCLFVDSEVATSEEMRFLRRAKGVMEHIVRTDGEAKVSTEGREIGELRVDADGRSIRFDRIHSPGTRGRQRPDERPDPFEFLVPRNFLHVDLAQLGQTKEGAEELRAILRRVHPDSTLHHGLSLPEALTRLYNKTIPERLGPNTEIQVLSPMNRGTVGASALNATLQAAVNPPRPERGEVTLGDRILRVGDRVIQRRNDYELGVFNGDIGRIVEVDAVEMTVGVQFDQRSGPRTAEPPPPPSIVTYRRDALAQLGLAYAITVHKSQGSEFPVVVIPIVTQHFSMLFRDLIYTALTRARRLAIFIGTRRALALAVNNTDPHQRQTSLRQVLSGYLDRATDQAI